MEEENMNQDRYLLNKNLAQMLKGGVIMDVTTPEQAKIAEEAAACAAFNSSNIKLIVSIFDLLLLYLNDNCITVI